MHDNRKIKIEVHATEAWLTLDWQRKHLAPLEIVAPEFNPNTDAFLFYEETVVEPSTYSKAPIEKRFGLLTEPSAGRPFSAKSISHVNQFRVIFTHDPFLLSLNLNYRKNYFGTSWVFQDADLVSAPPKSKIISMLTSNLSRLPGHKLRLSICKKMYNKKCNVDIFGRNIPWGPFIQDRRDTLAPYLFNISIENCRRNNYFTEKLVDCFVTRTVPIYWGCPNISEFFNTDGMIIINGEREFWYQFERVMSNPAGIYESHRNALEENCRMAIEKYNVRYAWGNVATQIANELKKEFKKAEMRIIPSEKSKKVEFEREKSP